MYIYNLSVSMANKKFSFETHPEMLDAIKAAIITSNSSFSSSRHKRTIEYQNLIDEKHIHLIMKSRDNLNPTRSLSSLSRALIKYEKANGLSLLNGCIANGCLFNAVVIEAPQKPLTIDDLTDSILLKSTIDLVYSTDEEKTQLKELILKYINEKTSSTSPRLHSISKMD